MKANEKGNLPDNEKRFKISMTYVISRESFKSNLECLFIIDYLCVITDIFKGFSVQMSSETRVFKVFVTDLVLLI